MVLGGEHNVFHTHTFSESDPFVRFELYRIESENNMQLLCPFSLTRSAFYVYFFTVF